jgi:hypothetical protein
MGMRELRAAMAMIARDGGGDFTGPIPQELIDRAAELLGVRFPRTYRHFLHELGCGDIGGAEFYGIGSDNLLTGPIPNGIWLTLDERETSRLSHQMVIVGADGTGGYYALDLTRADADGEAPVVLWQAGAPPHACPVVARDFGVFFRDEVAGAVGDDGAEEPDED